MENGLTEIETIFLWKNLTYLNEFQKAFHLSV